MNSKVYFDLFGVFADFFGEFAKVCGISSYKEYGQDFNQFIKYCEKHIHGTDFFLNLPKFEHTDKILEFAHQKFGSFNILSSPLAGDEKNTEILKKKWCENNLKTLADEVIITKDKTVFAKGNILIDDFAPNLKKWVDAGGIAIKFKANSLNYNENDLMYALEYIKDDIQKNGFKAREIFIHKDKDIQKYISQNSIKYSTINEEDIKKGIYKDFEIQIKNPEILNGVEDYSNINRVLNDLTNKQIKKIIENIDISNVNIEKLENSGLTKVFTEGLARKPHHLWWG